MKVIPAGPLKRVTFDATAVENNKPRVRRHEPVFLVEVEEGDSFVTYRAATVDMAGPVQTLYGTASGFIRFQTTGEVVLDRSDDAPAAPAAEKGKTKRTK